MSNSEYVGDKDCLNSYASLLNKKREKEHRRAVLFSPKNNWQVTTNICGA